MTPERQLRGIPFRALVPNAITVLALCVGLTGARFAFLERWDLAIICIVVAAILDALDGRVARMLKAQTRFGAELDSLSDVIAFGVSPALIVYLWSLQNLPRLGWVIALAHAVSAALRLARFNAAIDTQDQPHKSAGYLTGVPAPAGAGLLLLPVYISLWQGTSHNPVFVALWSALVAVMMIANFATFGWGSIRLKPAFRLGALLGVGLLGAALISEPWATLTVAAVIYAAVIPFSIVSYRKARRLRGTVPRPAGTSPDGA
jgi:CDP-diacylglycerol--serine O-phosphatidyltransferase